MENNDKMENLIMLLDDYEERIVGVHSVGDKINDKETAWIISKKFGFIERLVKNDKIEHIRMYQILETPTTYYDTYESMLMRLSIQDNPIEYLCSILKE